MSKTSVGTIRTELLEVADTVAREKGISCDEVLDAMEMAIQKASRAKYGMERDIRAHIDRKTGEIQISLYHEVVAEPENDLTQLSLEEARKVKSDIQLGEFIVDPLPPIEFGRVAAQTAKQVIFQRVRDAERQRQYDEFKNRVGEIISSVVKRVEFGNVFLELGQVEAFMAKDQLIPRENFKPGDRVRAYIMDVRQEPRGPQIFLSRTHPMFMAKLFAQEVPEIYEGDIEVKAVARDPGSRAKMAVTAGDKGTDPVGACVGVRGNRVQAIVNELQGEKVDIIPWSANPAVFVVNALVPAEALKVVLDEESHRVEVVVPDDQLSLAIGRRGQNVRLASELTKWNIDVISESAEAERRNKEIKLRTSLFVEALDVDDVIAHLLVAEGFESVEDIAYVALEELMAIEGFEEEIAAELQSRARASLHKQEEEFSKESDSLGVEKELAEFEGLTPKMLVLLARENIRTFDDFAGLAGDELIEIIPDLSLNDANAMIMKARERWFSK
jgi:N utilization substance protein A